MPLKLNVKIQKPELIHLYLLQIIFYEQIYRYNEHF
jgi:hypothetical protein